MLADFRTLRDPYRARSEYVECLAQDISDYYGYNRELVSALHTRRQQLLHVNGPLAYGPCTHPALAAGGPCAREPYMGRQHRPKAKPISAGR